MCRLRENMDTALNQALPEFIVLPVNGTPHLCTVAPDGVVEPRVSAPGNSDAIYKISSDRKFFGFLDSAHKRLAVYALLQAEPWLQRIVPPTNLPRDCGAHDFILHEGQLIVGGSSRTQENIWVLDYTLTVQPPRPWHALEVPESVRRSGKSIDLLYVLNNTLVAVDNVVRPKWFVFYRLSKAALPTTIGIHPLRVNSAFEGIRHGAESETMYALFSSGAGQRGASSYVQIYFKDEIALSASVGGVTALAREPALSDRPKALQKLKTYSISRRDHKQNLSWYFLTPIGYDNGER
jgi:hypothetical protein